MRLFLAILSAFGAEALFLGSVLLWAAGVGALSSYYQRHRTTKYFEGEE